MTYGRLRNGLILGIRWMEKDDIHVFICSFHYWSFNGKILREDVNYPLMCFLCEESVALVSQNKDFTDLLCDGLFSNTYLCVQNHPISLHVNVTHDWLLTRTLVHTVLPVSKSKVYIHLSQMHLNSVFHNS